MDQEWDILRNKCVECRDGEHDDYDDRYELCVVTDPETGEVRRRGILCGEHREAFAQDGYEIYVCLQGRGQRKERRQVSRCVECAKHGNLDEDGMLVEVEVENPRTLRCVSKGPMCESHRRSLAKEGWKVIPVGQV